MRYPADHKSRTRTAILDNAAKRLKRDGYEASGIKSLMADAGLTNGGFYAHFDSKEDMLAEALRNSLDQTHAMIERQFAAGDGLEAVQRIAEGYASAAHRDAPETGCPVPALSAEIARLGGEPRKAYGDGMNAIFDLVARHKPEEVDAAEREWAIALTAMLAGGVAMARAVEDESLSDEILAACRAMACRLAEVRGGEVEKRSG